MSAQPREMTKEELEQWNKDWQLLEESMEDVKKNGKEINDKNNVKK